MGNKRVRYSYDDTRHLPTGRGIELRGNVGRRGMGDVVFVEEEMLSMQGAQNFVPGEQGLSTGDGVCLVVCLYCPWLWLEGRVAGEGRAQWRKG